MKIEVKITAAGGFPRSIRSGALSRPVAADVLDMAVGKYDINALGGQQRTGIAFDLCKPTELFSGVKIDNA